MNNTIAVKDYRRSKPMRVNLGSTTARASKGMLKCLARYVLLLTIVASSYVSTFYAGAISTFTSDDWDAISLMTISEVKNNINKVIPMFGTVTLEDVNANRPIVMDGKSFTKAEFCAMARDTGLTERSFDVATECL